MPKGDLAAAEPRKTRAFISYSRQDGALALSLSNRLQSKGFDAYLDVDDIVKGEAWRKRLHGLIASADAMLFLISPASVTSKECDWEVNEAELLGKRILPVIIVETPDADIPQRLRRLNYTFLDTPAQDTAEFPKLVSALREDAAWVREHTRLLELATRWDAAGRPNRLLLRDRDIDASESWRDQRQPTAPQLSSLHASFLAESRRNASRVLQNWVVGLAVLGVAVAALAGIAINQRNEAIDQRLAAESSEASLRSDIVRATEPENALTLALSAFDKKATPASLGVVRRSVDDVILRRIRTGVARLESLGGGPIARWARSRDRSRIAVGEGNETILVLDGETLNEIARLKLPGPLPKEIAISTTGLRVAAVDGSRKVAIWTVAMGAQPIVIAAPHEVEHVQFGRTEAVVALVGQDDITFYRMPAMTPLSSVRRSVLGSSSVAFSPNDSLAVVVGRKNQAWVIDPAAGSVKATLDLQAQAAILKPTLGGSEASILARAYFLDDGKSVVTIGGHAFWSRWDALTGKRISSARGLSGLGTRWALFDRSGSNAFTEEGTTGRIVGWDLRRGNVSHSFDVGHRSLIDAADMNADGNLVASIGSDQTLMLWSVAEQRRVAAWRVSMPRISDASFTASGKHLVTLTFTGELALWDVGTVIRQGRLTPTSPADEVRFDDAEFSADGKRLVTRTADSTIAVWDVEHLALLSNLVGHKGDVNHATISDDGARVATVGRDETVRVWDAGYGTELARFPGKFAHAAFARSGSILAVNDFDGRVRVFSIADRRLISEANYKQNLTNAVALSPDGRFYAVTGNDGTAIVATTEEGRIVSTLRLGGIPFRRARFGADGKYLYTTHDGNVVRAWNLGTPSVVAEMRGHSQLVPRVRILADDQLVLSPSEDASIRLWDAQDGSLVRAFGTQFAAVFDAVFVEGVVVSVDRSGRVWRQACDACRGDEDVVARARAKLRAIGNDPGQLPR